MLMPVRTAVAMGMHFCLDFCRDQNDPPVSYAALGNDMRCEVFDGVCCPPEERDLQATLMIKRDAHGCDRQVVVVVVRVGKFLG